MAQNRPLLVLAMAVMLTVTTLVIRGVFRSMELINGWRSMLATTEKFQIALEGSVMALGLVCLNVWHPERLIREARVVAEGQARHRRAVELEEQAGNADKKNGVLAGTEG